MKTCLHLRRQVARWGLVLISALLVGMQMYSSLDTIPEKPSGDANKAPPTREILQEGTLVVVSDESQEEGTLVVSDDSNSAVSDKAPRREALSLQEEGPPLVQDSSTLPSYFALKKSDNPQYAGSPELEPPHAIDSTSIRKWGCARNETPFVFVHIGKAGGGGVRARIAASALDYNRQDWFKPKNDESYYYPMYDPQGNLHPGKLISSEAGNFIPHFPHQEDTLPFQRTFRFEGSFACHATTPLGHAVACHMEKNLCHSHRGRPNEDAERCDAVYMGHNVLGGELGFLPTQYLLNWWTNTTWHQRDSQIHPLLEDQIATRLANRYNRSHRVFEPHRANPARRNCDNGSLKKFMYNKLYEKCILPEAQLIDKAATVTNLEDFWAPVYASLPVLRVTMLREPFSWLKSKFFWMSDHMNTHGQGGTVLGWRGKDRTQRMVKNWDEAKREKYQNATFVKCDDLDNFVRGWGKQGALEYIFYLCGEHCMGQWQAIQETYSEDAKVLKQKHLEYLKVMEAQAAYNLRNSFSVVGLLQETQEFFDMISQRVYYMDTSLNPLVQGQSHSSGTGPEQTRCNNAFKNETFRQEILNRSPEIAATVRLYQLGIRVNAFQKDELSQC